MHFTTAIIIFIARLYLPTQAGISGSHSPILLHTPVLFSVLSGNIISSVQLAKTYVLYIFSLVLVIIPSHVGKAGQCTSVEKQWTRQNCI